MNELQKIRDDRGLVVLLLLVSALLLSLILAPGQTNPVPTGLDWNAKSTNTSMLTWTPWTNGTVIRYSFFWTWRTNSDTGTNYVTTTNWYQFADCNSDVTNASLRLVPTNTLITMVITVPGGLKTVPITPWPYTNWPGPYITNQPSYP